MRFAVAWPACPHGLLALPCRRCAARAVAVTCAAIACLDAVAGSTEHWLVREVARIYRIRLMERLAHRLAELVAA